MLNPISFLPTVSLLATIAFASGPAFAGVIVFSDDFSSGTAAAEFSGVNTVVDAGGYKGLGGFADNFLFNATGIAAGAATLSTDLALSGLASHTTMTIAFDLAMIDSWDGLRVAGGIGADFFNLSLDATEIFEISVDNAQGRFDGFSFDAIPATAAQTVNEGGYFGSTVASGMGDFFDYDRGFSVSVTLAHSSSSAALSFFADGPGYHNAFGAADESWAIDNLSVSTNAVPEPTTLALLGMGLAGIGFMRRL